MENILKKPYTNKEYAEFAAIATANNQRIEIGVSAAFALYPWEILEGELIVDISDTPEFIEQQKQAEFERIQHLTLTQRQLRLYLLEHWGLTDADIRKYLDDAGIIEWEYASVFVRGNPLFNQVAILIGKTPKDVDIMF